ncbi:hypothetical protein [Saccharothrix lopnurensis]|uniref:Uncharacterized protein n=1 Tax=Saccharothrix lopnurensis TaxID=1670621 RepID=A0ABW1P7J1_9PSEU
MPNAPPVPAPAPALVRALDWGRRACGRAVDPPPAVLPLGTGPL